MSETRAGNDEVASQVGYATERHSVTMGFCDVLI